MGMQEIIVALILVGCMIFIGLRIYRNITNACNHKSKCDNCIADCKLRTEMQQRKQKDEKKK